MSRNMVAGLATAALIVAVTVMEVIASSKDLPHDGIQPSSVTSSVLPTSR